MKTEAEDWRFAQGHTASQWSGPDDKGRALPVWSLTVRSTALPLRDPREGGRTEIRGGPRSALRSLGLKESPLALELCDSANFLSTFRGGRRGHSWKENSPERSQSHLQKWLQGDWNLESSMSHHPPPWTLGGHPEQVPRGSNRGAGSAEAPAEGPPARAALQAASRPLGRHVSVGREQASSNTCLAEGWGGPVHSPCARDGLARLTLETSPGVCG